MHDRGAWRLLAALTALNVLAFVDRQLVAALAPVLRADLGLRHSEVGLLIGVAFVAAFAVGLPVMGLLADRVRRPRLVAAGLGLWSVGTALGGTASGFGSLAAWRTLVGVGEATLSPTAVAMLGDRFPPARLGLAASVFYSGIPLGYSISLAFAAAVAPRLGWRACFVVLGVAGLASVAFVWRMADARSAGPPAAGGPGGDPAGPPPERHEPVVRRLGTVIASQPLLPALVAGGALLAFTSAASQHIMNWLVSERGYSFERAGFVLAASILVAGGLGGPAIGASTDRARRRGPGARLLRFVALGAFALVATLGLYTLPPGTPLFYASWLVAQGWALGWFGPVLAAIHEMAPDRSRATVLGFALLAVNLLGVATGPWVTGLIADRTSLTTGLQASLGPMAAGLLVVLLVAIALGKHAPRIRP